MRKEKNDINPLAHEEIELLNSVMAREKAHESDPWRVLRIQSEIVDGFENLRGIGKAVSIFGSARLDENHPFNIAARDAAKALAKEGIAIITGGGPGIMQACNKGAYPEKGASIGLNIELPEEQAPNDYQNLSLAFRYFFVRKLMFVRYACAFIFFPGGFGTLDELFDVLTLMQTGKIPRKRIVLFGSEHWKSFLKWIDETLVETFIDQTDAKLYTLVDHVEELIAIIKEAESE